MPLSMDLIKSNSRLRCLWATLIIALSSLVQTACYDEGSVGKSQATPVVELPGCTDGSPSPEASFFVSSHGNDAWDGVSVERPFLTIRRAQNAVRAINSKMSGNIVVLVEAGNYFLNEPLTFTEADSGTGGYKVIYRNAGAVGSARLIGGARLAGWMRYSDNIYQVPIPRDWTVTTLYEDGIRAEEARFPNRNNPASLPESHSPYLTEASTSSQLSSSVVSYRPGDIPTLNGNLSGLKVFIWSGHDWFTDIVPVAHLDPSTSQITLAQETRYPIKNGSRYFIEGALSLLDAPGEFFHDSSNGILYYWPRTPDIEDREIIVPTLRTLLSVQGSSPDAPVRDLRFEGLAFEASQFTNWYRFGWPRAGQSGEQHKVSSFDRQIEMPINRLGMVTFENTERVDMIYSHIKNAGFGGIYLLFSNQQDRICGNLIEHIGINGITLQGRYPGEGDVIHHNVLSNNLIRYVGEMVGNAAGVDISDAGFNQVSHSQIHDSPRYGVLWHAGVPPGTPSYVQHNVFEYLRISGVAQDSGDTGALYSFGLSADSSNPRTNLANEILIDNVYADPSMSDILPNAVFTDNDSSTQVFQNILARGISAPPTGAMDRRCRRS